MTPYIPSPAALWRSSAGWIWAMYVLAIAAAIPHVIVQFWFNESLGYDGIFWTNLRMQALLFCTAGLLAAGAVMLPVLYNTRSRRLRRASITVGIWTGTAAGWWFSGHYQQFLLARHGVPFGRVDPVFGHDIGFYIYTLPAWQAILTLLEAALIIAVASAILVRWHSRAADPPATRPEGGTLDVLGQYATPWVTGALGALGVVVAVATFLGRYDLLLMENEAAGVRVGAGYVDLVGPISRLNYIYLLTVVELGLVQSLVLIMVRLHRRAASARSNFSLRSPVRLAAVEVAIAGAAYCLLAAQTHVNVAPNEPHIQRDFIKRHIDATRTAYRLEHVEVHEWAPPGQPVPAARLLASETLRSAPILPGWVSSLETPPDIQHLERLAVSESTMVYGPMLHIFAQQQQLRPYYKFLSVDALRYRVDGRKRMYVSAVRELPSLAFVGPKEWLRYWGSAALMLTHGMGLVMSPADAVDENGSALYAVKDLPPESSHADFTHEPRIYIGEGMRDDYVLTNIRGLQEFDYATEQSRAEFTLPEPGTGGIPVNSLVRRLVFAAYTGDVTAFLFSGYIDHDRTRVHVRRTPLSRARSLAPFLFLDSNTYAFIADGRVSWMINGLTTTDRYPYSFREVLGDKADERAVESFPERVINYAEDSVKITVDAYSGAIRFFQVASDPIVDTWSRVYPNLFEPIAAMPKAARAQVTYPLQWFHVQFDDIYKRYHQLDPIEFYNVEDLWDDADETLGSLGRGLSGFGTGDQMTFSYEGYHALIDPADLPPGPDIGEPGDLQYAMLMPFTPEGGRNLRALVVALQDPEQYGRLLSLQIPQGTFVAGPEQVDAYIDNDRPVHQQVTMWIRHASEVIRGSTLLLPVAGDLAYVETFWTNSLQNSMPQLRLFALWHHGRITSGPTLEEAIEKRRAIDTAPSAR